MYVQLSCIYSSVGASTLLTFQTTIAIRPWGNRLGGQQPVSSHTSQIPCTTPSLPLCSMVKHAKPICCLNTPQAHELSGRLTKSSVEVITLFWHKLFQHMHYRANLPRVVMRSRPDKTAGSLLPTFSLKYMWATDYVQGPRPSAIQPRSCGWDKQVQRHYY